MELQTGRLINLFDFYQPITDVVSWPMRDLNFCSTQFMRHPVCLSMHGGILSIKIGNPNCFKFRECCLFLEVCSSPTPHWFLYSFNAKLFDGRNKYTQQRYLTRKNNKMNVKVLLSTKEVSSFKRDSNANLLFWDCLKVRLLQCAKIFDSNSFCTLLCGCVSEKERRFDFLHFYI